MKLKISKELKERIAANPFKLEDFEDTGNSEYLEMIIRALNKLREMYYRTDDVSYMVTLLTLLPETYKYRGDEGVD